MAPGDDKGQRKAGPSVVSVTRDVLLWLHQPKPAEGQLVPVSWSSEGSSYGFGKTAKTCGLSLVI